MVKPNGSGGYYEYGFRGIRRYCAVCGLGFYDDEMVIQDGVYKCKVGPVCIDEKDDDD